MWKSLSIAILIGATLIWGQFFECHDDPAYQPQEGAVAELQFTWLGALQYIHVKNGTPHYFRVPRVLLITRRFVVSSAEDASQVPEGYALGNVVLADYERDEQECHTTPQDLATRKTQCEPGILVMPVADVLLHPEYKNFGAKTSVALLKLVTVVRSAYVIPVCLPLRDFLVEKGRTARQKFYYVDFSSDVPRDFVEEEKELSRLSLLPRELCFLYDDPHVSSGPIMVVFIDHGNRAMKERVTCTTGCGFRSGAPILVHEHTGHWSVVALSQGGYPCPDPLRVRRPPAPPQHIMLYPYVPWITTAISGYSLGIRAKDDPFGFAVPRASGEDPAKDGWVGHWWMGGIRCFDRAEASLDMFRFYHEVFQVKPVNRTTLHYFLMVSAGPGFVIVCVKVGMPYRLGIPTLWELYTSEIRIRIPLVLAEGQYSFQVEAWAYNETELLTESSSSSTMEPLPTSAPVFVPNLTTTDKPAERQAVARAMKYWQL